MAHERKLCCDKDLTLLDHAQTETDLTKPEPVSSSEQLTSDSEHLDAGPEQTNE